MNGRFQGSTQAVNSLGINIYLAKVFSSLLWKPSRAMKHLLASQQALQRPCCWRLPRGFWELTIHPFLPGSRLATPGCALTAQDFPVSHPPPHSFPFSQSPLVFVLEPGTQATSVCQQAKCDPHHQPAILSLQHLEKWCLSFFLCVCMCVYENVHVCLCVEARGQPHDTIHLIFHDGASPF